MRILNLLSQFSSMALASESKDHSHSMGELEHAWPVAAVFAGLMITGFVYNYFSKKSK